MAKFGGGLTKRKSVHHFLYRFVQSGIGSEGTVQLA